MKDAHVVQIVVNPRAGGQRRPSLLGPLTAALKARGYHPSIFVTAAPGDALRWAKTCQTRPDYLICLGGDNTLSELAYAATRQRIPLIPVPTGFGNIIAREFGHQAEVASVLRLLETGEEINVDVGIHEGIGTESQRYFLAATSYGFLEAVKLWVEDTKCPRDRSLRWLRYILGAANHFRSLPLPALTVEVDGEIITQEAAIALVANVPAYPGQLLLTPGASPLDGLFDVCVIPACSKRELLASLLALFLNTPSAEAWTIRRRGKVVRISAIPGRPLFGSGRFISSSKGQGIVDTLTVRPRAVPILVDDRYRLHRRKEIRGESLRGGDTDWIAVGSGRRRRTGPGVVEEPSASARRHRQDFFTGNRPR